MDSDLKEIKKALAPKEKRPSFKKLFKRRLIGQAKRKLKKNYAFVLRIKSNGQIIPSLVQIKDEMIYLKEEGTYHDASSQNILWWGKYPILLQPEWDTVPISPAMYGKLADKEGRLATSGKVYVHAAKQADIAKGGFKGKALLWIIIAVVAGLYILSEIIG